VLFEIIVQQKFEWMHDARSNLSRFAERGGRRREEEQQTLVAAVLVLRNLVSCTGKYNCDIFTILCLSVSLSVRLSLSVPLSSSLWYCISIDKKREFPHFP